MTRDRYLRDGMARVDAVAKASKEAKERWMAEWKKAIGNAKDPD